MRWGGYEAFLCNSKLKRAGLSLLKGENSWDVLCSHIHTLFILHTPHAPLKQSALSVERWSIKKPLIMALYSLLLDVNFNLQSLIQFPFIGVAGSAPKGQDNEGRRRKSPQAGTGGVWRGSLGIPFFWFLLSLCLHREFDCPDGGAFKLYWRREWHFPAALK